MLNRTDSVLVVIDLQDSLLTKMAAAEEVVTQSVKLIQCARSLDIPVFLTEQYPKGLGPTTSRVAELFGEEKPLEKTAFGCFAEAGFEELVAQTGRNQLLLAGVETHVCVLQTALQASEEGYMCHVVRDATTSRKEQDYIAGLARMEANNVQIVTAEMAIFEWLRVAGTPEFKKVLPFIK